MKYATSEKQCSELKAEVMDLTQKLSVLKEKVCLKRYRFFKIFIVLPVKIKKNVPMVFFLPNSL